MPVPRQLNGTFSHFLPQPRCIAMLRLFFISLGGLPAERDSASTYVTNDIDTPHTVTFLHPFEEVMPVPRRLNATVSQFLPQPRCIAPLRFFFIGPAICPSDGFPQAFTEKQVSQD